jgi:Fe2+ or Zn2+ uptake regulation protein
MLKQIEMFPSQEKSYFDTTKLAKKELLDANAEATAQENNILQIFKKHSPLSPSDVWRIYERNFGSILLTSVRRSITVLTKKGLLTKTNLQKISVYNAKEFIWKIN